MALIAVLNGLAMVVIVPIGLSLTAMPGTARLARWWPWAGAVAALALWLPRGPVAVGLCLPYAVLALALDLVAARWVWHGQLRSARDLALVTALVAPTVAVSALLAERAGVHLMGFDLRVLALTVAHFHAAGFAAALVASLGADAAGPAGQLAAAAVPVGLLVVFAGFFTTAWVGVAGTMVLTAGMWLIAWTTIRRRRGVRDRLTRTLFGVAAVVPLATMVLALDWALGRATGLAHLNVTWMVATHGAANLLGFAVCGLLAWRRLHTLPASTGPMLAPRAQ